ncbi:MAG: SulP family inorganic anion transporter [Patescibacteria group bacterium]
MKKLLEKLGWIDLKEALLNYNFEKFKSDFLAGALVAVVAFPSVMAFAMLAGLNPINGLHSLMIATIIGALFGVSSFMVMGPTNIIALLIANAVGVIAIGSLSVMEAVIILTLLTGIIQVILSFINFGKLAGFISRPVIVGLITGVAVAIAGDQLPKILGLQIEAENILTSIYYSLINIQAVNLYTLFIGLSTILIVIVVRRFSSRAPDYLLAVLFSILLIYFFGLESEVELIGSFQNSLPEFSIPNLNFDLIARLLSYAFAAAMLGFIDVVTITEFNRKGAVDEKEINQDYLGLGIVNIACSLFGGFVGGGSFSRSFVNFKAGAKTRISQLIAGLFVLLFLIFFSSVISLLPVASLSAILILVAFQMVDLDEIKKILRTTRFDSLIFASTFVATVFIPRLDYAVYIGILFSLILVIKNSSKVNYSYLKIDGEEINQHDLEDLEGENQIIIDFSGTLHFNTVCNLEKELGAAFEKGDVFILRMRNVESVDITTLSELEQFVDKVRNNGGDVFFAGLPAHLEKDFKKYGLIGKLGERNYFSKEKGVFTASKKAIKEVEEKRNKN